MSSNSRRFPEAKKRFGQHFLHDQGTIERIVAAIAPRPDQQLIEIGPGTGALTLPLLRAIGELDVIEFDRDLVAALQASCAELGLLRVHRGDALRCELAEFITDQRRLRIVGNLPYNISTPLIFHFLQQLDCVQDMVFMVQREVAERLSAGAATEHYGRLSVMVQYACRVEKLLTVAPGAFHPPPQVYSTVVRLIPDPAPVPAHDPVRFAEIVRNAFGQRRKTLRNSLKGTVDMEAFAAAEINPGQRAETLTVPDFIRLANVVSDRLR